MNRNTALKAASPLLILLCRRCAVSGDLSEGKHVRLRVAAQAVACVDAAGHFTGSPQPRDSLSVLVQNIGVRVNNNTTHSVVQGSLPWGDADPQIRIGVHRLQINTS